MYSVILTTNKGTRFGPYGLKNGRCTFLAFSDTLLVSYEYRGQTYPFEPNVALGFGESFTFDPQPSPPTLT